MSEPLNKYNYDKQTFNSKTSSQLLNEQKKIDTLINREERQNRISNRLQTKKNIVANNNNDVLDGGKRKSKARKSKRKGKRVKKTRRHRHK